MRMSCLEANVRPPPRMQGRSVSALTNPTGRCRICASAAKCARDPIRGYAGRAGSVDVSLGEAAPR